jgi:hypothetical protein
VINQRKIVNRFNSFNLPQQLILLKNLLDLSQFKVNTSRVKLLYLSDTEAVAKKGTVNTVQSFQPNFENFVHLCFSVLNVIHLVLIPFCYLAWFVVVMLLFSFSFLASVQYPIKTFLSF